jgi:hypothetical protein
MFISYDLIGAFPAVESYRDTLPTLIADFRRDRLDTQFETIIECAAHFYGINALDYETPDGLLDAIEGLDQQLEFQ